MKNINSFFRIIQFGFSQAIDNLKLNKSRAFLSIIGIAFGMLCISGVIIGLNSLEKNIEFEIKSLGTQTFYVDKWDYDNNSKIPKWQLAKRPLVTLQDANFLKQNLTNANAVSFMATTLSTIKVDTKNENAFTIATNADFLKIQQLKIENGRAITENEFENATPVALIGNNLATKLFTKPNDALNQNIYIQGKKTTIVGIIAKEENKFIQWNYDESVFISIYFAQNFLLSKNTNVVIITQAKKNTTNDEFKNSLKLMMRANRNLSPDESDNFSLNSVEGFANAVADIFKSFTIVGVIIGSIGLIVGLFGIVNILFISVVERTNIIGLKKALGATPINIASEFLIESILLTFVGSGLGFLIAYSTAFILGKYNNFIISMNWNMIFSLFFLTLFIGIIAGYFPAKKAAKMQAAEALGK